MSTTDATALLVQARLGIVKLGENNLTGIVIEWEPYTTEIKKWLKIIKVYSTGNTISLETLEFSVTKESYEDWSTVQGNVRRLLEKAYEIPFG